MGSHRIGLAFALAVWLLAGSTAACAQAYPSKPVKFVLPGPPGSGPDQVVRLLADRLGTAWAVPVIVENRAGATGTIGSDYVVRSAPDGYTALFAFTSIVQAAALLPKVPFDFEKDLAPVSLVSYAPIALTVQADSPIRNLAQYLASAKNPAAPLSYGVLGTGSSAHILAETLRRAAGAQFTHVPYKGEAAALADLLGGQIQSAWAGVGAARSFVVSGRLRALAVAAPTRSRALPEVPTFTELGYPDVGTVSWFGVLVPAATSRTIVEKLSADINRVLAQNDVMTRLSDSGVEPAGTSPERFAEVLRVDIPKWQRMIKEARIKLD